MTWQLGHCVESGELHNTTCNQTHGWLRLRGWRRPLFVSLTGNAAFELAGRRWAFDAASPLPADPLLRHLARQQIGPTGQIARLDEDGLYIEWFGQNGHVECRLGRTTRLELTEVECEAAARLAPPAPRDSLFRSLPGLGGPDGLRPAKLVEQDDWETRFQLLDRMLETDEEAPIGSLIEPPLHLPPPEQLAPPELVSLLKHALARLALLGISLDLCEHFTDQDAYRLLRDRIWWEETVHPDLAASGYIMHFLSYEYCPVCRAQESSWVDSVGSEAQVGSEE